jgi:hypothetical protein
VKTEVVEEKNEREEQRRKLSLNSRELAKRCSNRIAIAGICKTTEGQPAHAVADEGC